MGANDGTGDDASEESEDGDDDDGGPKFDVGPGMAGCPEAEIRDVGPLSLGGPIGSISHTRVQDGYLLTAGIPTEDTVVTARTDADGVIDPATLFARRGFHPEVAFSGQEVLLVYAGGPEVWETAYLRVARLALDGHTIMDDALVPDEGHLQDIWAEWHPVAKEWGVVWDFSPGGYSSRIRFARVDADGTLVPDSMIELNDPNELTQLADARSLVVTAEGYAVALAHARDFELVRLDTAGRLLSRSSISTEGQPSNVAIAAGDESFGLAWQEGSVDGGPAGFDVSFVRADADGTLDADSQVVWPQGVDLSYGNPTAVWDGLRYQVVWTAEDGAGNTDLFHGVPDDALLGSVVTFGSKYAWFPRAQWNGCELVVAYAEGEPGTPADGRLLFIPGPALIPEG